MQYWKTFYGTDKKLDKFYIPAKTFDKYTNGTFLETNQKVFLFLTFLIS